MRLEQDLGVRLLHRTTRHLALTDEGRLFYERCRRVLAELDAAEQELRPAGDPIQGTVRVVLPPATVKPGFLEQLRELLDDHPRLGVQIEIANAGLEHLAHGVDLVLHVGPVPETTLVARRIATVAWLLAASPGYLERHGRPRRPADLARHRCLRFLGDRSQTEWRLLDRNGREVTAKVGGTFESDDSRVLADATYAGLGVGIRPRPEVEAAVATGRLEHVLPGYVFDRIVLHALLPAGRIRPAACGRAGRAAARFARRHRGAPMTASSNALSESLTGRARAMHLHIAMATHTTNPLEHDHSGVRWLAPALVAMAALVLFAIAMLGYPYL